jgi:hypothetical protein
MARDLCYHQERTSSTSDAPTTTNTTEAAARIFREFIPGAPFHPPILHSTVAPPTSVIRLHANSLPERDKPQSLSKSPDPWSSLALRHVRRTRQQYLSFRTPIYTIPARRSTFTPIASALALAQSIPSWVFSRFGSVGATRASPCGSGGPVLGALRGSRVE